MGTAAIATAIAVKQAIEKYDFEGTVKVFGSPAEEMLVSRPYMVRAGLFEGRRRFSACANVAGRFPPGANDGSNG